VDTGPIINVFNSLLAVGAAVSLAATAFFVMLAGFQYMSAGGSVRCVESAKGSLYNALIGFAIVILCRVVAGLVGTALGAPGVAWRSDRRRRRAAWPGSGTWRLHQAESGYTWLLHQDPGWRADRCCGSGRSQAHCAASTRRCRPARRGHALRLDIRIDRVGSPGGRARLRCGHACAHDGKRAAHACLFMAGHRAIEIVRTGSIEGELARGGLANRCLKLDTQRVNGDVVLHRAHIDSVMDTFLAAGSGIPLGLNLNSDAVSEMFVGRLAAAACGPVPAPYPGPDRR